jgi:hypothetical protein
LGPFLTHHFGAPAGLAERRYFDGVIHPLVTASFLACPNAPETDRGENVDCSDHHSNVHFFLSFIGLKLQVQALALGPMSALVALLVAQSKHKNRCALLQYIVSSPQTQKPYPVLVQ